MAQTLAFQFRKKYQLTANDPRFLDSTIDDMLIDLYAHAYSEKGNVDEVEDEDFDLNEVLKSMESDDWETLVGLNGE